MRARPHHLIDIICQYGAGRPFKPHPYGHAVHLVAAEVIENPDVVIEFVVDADDICAPCVHLVDGRCDDIITICDPPLPKQLSVDRADAWLLTFLRIAEGRKMTFREYLGVLRANLDCFRAIYSHPDSLALGDDPDRRLSRLRAGLEKLGA